MRTILPARRAFAPLLLLLLPLVGAGCRGQCTPTGAPAGQSVGFLAQFAADQCLATAGGQGLSVTLSDARGVVGQAASGEADAGRDLGVSTPMRLGPVSELYAAALVAKLVDRRSLTLDSDVAAALDWFDVGSPITLRDLLSHRTGLRDVYSIRAIDLGAIAGPQALVETIMDDGLAFDPGSKHQISGTNYLLLGLFLEQRLGDSYGKILHDELLGPHGLGATWVEGYDELPTDLALGHTRGGDTMDGAFASENGGAALSIVASAADVDSLTELFFADEAFISDETRFEATFPVGESFGDDGYGLGMEIATVNGETVWRRAGEHPGGYAAGFAWMPESGASAVALGNAAGGDAGWVVDTVAGWVADADGGE